MGMGRRDAELEELYRRRHVAFQSMLASVTGSVESARDVVQEAFAQALFAGLRPQRRAERQIRTR